jgi:hypothetical protein
MDTIGLLSQPNRGQYAPYNFSSAISKKYSLGKDGSADRDKATLLPPDDDFLMVSFSDEGRKMLQDQKEADRKATMRRALENIQANNRKLAEQNRTAKEEAAAKKIGEIKARLKELLASMRMALKKKKKKGAATIAKEAAVLAKELTAALKDSGSTDQTESNPTPVVDDGNSKESEEAADAAEKATNKNPEAGNAAQKAAAKWIANEALAKTAEVSVGAGQDDELKQIAAMLKSMKGTMARKNSSDPSEKMRQAGEIQRESEKAESEIEEAIRVIEAA